MKLLYLSCHEVLEFDELSLLASLGVETFSIGAYLDPAHPTGQALRPPISGLQPAPDDLAAFHALSKSPVDGRKRLTREFVRRFDGVIVMHVPDWIETNWPLFHGIPVIWRTIGQSNPTIERRMQAFRRDGLKIVRYSPRERRLANYCGEDAVIRFGKPAADIPPWTGRVPSVVSFAQSMRARSLHCRYELFREISAPFPCELFGGGNDDVPQIARGPVSAEEQRRILSSRRVFVYTGTYPASYTLAFIEAWMAGIPVVAIGRELWQSGEGAGGELYEIPDLIQNGDNGFVSDSVAELQGAVRRLLDDPQLAQSISLRGRESAITLFDGATIAGEWRAFLDVHVRNDQPAQLTAQPTVCDEFVSRDGWFDRRYRALCDGRFPTFKIALGLFLQNRGQTIVETGCIRQADDYGAGCSTVLFSEFLHRYGGKLFSVDINAEHLALAGRLTAEFACVRALICDDSVRFLSTGLASRPDFSGRIDLLYLDSLDFPFAELLERASREELFELDDDTVAARFPELVLPPQQHCLAELEAARPYLGRHSVVLIDDNEFPGGGKARLARRRLYEWGWKCVLDLQQTVWVAGDAFLP